MSGLAEGEAPPKSEEKLLGANRKVTGVLRDGACPKVVHFVRHAQATHNLAAEQEGRAAYTQIKHLDARLTDKGKDQCAKLKPQMDKLSAEIELVVISPLSRAIETAKLSVEKKEGIPWIVLECVRERAAGHPCDKRRPVKEMAVEHPDLDWSQMADNEDVYYDQLGGDAGRETEAEMLTRCFKLFDWLEQRPETNITVVTHSAILSVLFSQAISCGPRLNKWFENCEHRTTVLNLQ